MNLEIRDPFLLATVAPRNLESYLQAAGWQMTFHDPGVVSVWTLPGNPDDYEVQVPLDAQASAYAQRVKEALQEISAAEQRPQLRVFLDVQEWNCDIIRLAYKARADMDYPSLGTAANTLENARDILTALASAVIDPQPWYGKKHPKEATEYVAALEVSPFEEPLGVRILARLQPLLFEADEDEFVPLTRRVSLRLRDALDHLQRLLNWVDPHTREDWLTASLNYGLSANVTEGLSNLLHLPSAMGSSVEISLRLSAARTFTGPALSSWSFRRSHLPIIGEIRERLKTFAAGPDDKLLFLVGEIRLGKRARIVTGTALIDDEARRIEMSVDDELIRIAELAKARNDAVQCSGRLRRRPDSGRYEVLQPHDFQVIHAEDASVAVLRRKMPQMSPGSLQLPLISEHS